MANNPQASGGQALRPLPVGSMGSQNFGPPFYMQFRPMVPVQQGQHFMPVSSALQQFHPAGQGLLPGQGQPPQFSQPLQQLQSRPLQPGSATPSSQATQMPYLQQNMSFTSGSQQFQQAAPPNNHAHGFGGPGVPLSSSYTFASSSFGQPENTMNMASQFQPISQMHTPVVPVAGQPWLPSGSRGLPVGTPMQPTGQQPSSPAGPVPAVNVPNSSQHISSDWQEFEAGDGRRYYYNKITKQSCWEKPLELMTPLEGKITTALYAHYEGGFNFSRYTVCSYPERADASTVWKEFTTAEGRKYYYNKITKQSKWSIPDELKLAREKAATQESQSEVVAATEGTQSEMVDALATPLSSTEQASTEQASTTVATSGVASSPLLVTPVVNAPLIAISGLSTTPVVNSSATTAAGVSSLTASPAFVPESIGTPVALLNASTTPITGSENSASHDVGNSFNGASVQDIEETKKGMPVAGRTNVTPLEEKTVEDEPLLYASKQEAKNAFKALLESANVEADWNWEQAMRVIINDKRYGALKTLGERKQAFNEYLMQRKKLEAEERRLRQRKAKEEFTKMLEESRELTSSMRWSKAITIFEDDERFKAVERAADREDLFKNYMVDLHKKEKTKAQEEYRQNRLDYRNFLETCGLIKVDTQWRKVQDRLEDDESGSRLEKIDRLEIFQEYIRDLEKEEDEQRKIKKELIKRVERKNRDEFRKIMEEHVASGTLTAKTQWRDYCQKVKDSAPYQAVALNLSGSTPKDLFEDVAEELQIQYDEDKAHIKDAIKSGKITIASTWTFEDFRAAIPESIGSPPVSHINLQLVFEDLLERVKEKEEKEAKKLQRLAEDFSDKLSTIKEITASSNWEECKQLFEGSSEYRSIREESSAMEIFEEYVARLQEKARDKERKREEEKAKKEKEREEKEKRKEKERREKAKEKEREREREREKCERSKKDDGESENLDASNNYGHKEDKKREKDRDRKDRKMHKSDLNSDKDEKEDSYKKSRRQGSEEEKEDLKKCRRHGSEDEKEDYKKSHRHGSEDEKEDSKKSQHHGSDHKKSRKHAYTPESDSESKHKRHKRDYWDGSRRNGGHEELEDGELGEDGEIR